MTSIIANNVSCQRGHYQLFKPISFSLDGGQSILISGSNGIGKTTLLETIAGLRMIQSGELKYNSIALNLNLNEWHQQSFFIGHKSGHKKELNCLENLMSFLHIQGVQCTQLKAENALDDVGLAGYEYQMAGSLSAGQKKRLSLARLNLVNHPIWILDEPFVNLDKKGCDWLLTTLLSHLKQNGVLIITAHDNQAIKDIATQEIWLEAQI